MPDQAMGRGAVKLLHRYCRCVEPWGKPGTWCKGCQKLVEPDIVQRQRDAWRAMTDV